MTTTFNPGQTYSASMICDHNCIVSITVAKRTAKFLTTTDGKRLGISVYDDAEQIYPDGHYSMCTVISATAPAVILTDWQRAAQRKTEVEAAKASAPVVTPSITPALRLAVEAGFVSRCSIVPVKCSCGHTMLRLMRDTTRTTSSCPCEVCRGDLTQADADAHNLEVLRHG